MWSKAGGSGLALPHVKDERHWREAGIRSCDAAFNSEILGRSLRLFATTRVVMRGRFDFDPLTGAGGEAV